MPLASIGAVGALAGAVGSLAGNYITNQFNQSNIGITNAANLRMVYLQNQANEALWEKQTAYNDIVNQVRRLRAAGLNPGIMYGQGSVANTADSPPTMQASKDMAFQSTFNIDPLTAATIANINADTDKKRSETQYQDYMNEVERQLSKIPIGEVRTVTDDGTEGVEVVYGNARVMMTKTDLKKLQLSENGLQWQLNDLFYDLAVKFGDYSFAGSVTDQDPMNTPDYGSAVAAMRGDYQVRRLAGQLADVSYEAAKAQNAGKEAYSEWLDKHKDDPVVKFALTLQGFFQTTGISLPSISVNNGPKGRAVNWMFGK